MSIESLTTIGAAFLIAFAGIAALKRTATARGWMDHPGSNPLKIHKRPVPLVGGPGMALGTLVVVPIAAWSAGDTLLPMALLLLPALAMVVLGLYDDLRGLQPRTRLGAEILAATAVAVGGIVSRVFAVPIDAPPFSILILAFLVVVYLVGGVNALNMQDGMDGLAGSLALITCAGLIVVSAQQGHQLLEQTVLALAGSICAFLVYNAPPASVFMGDGGSYFLGFLIGAVAVILGAGHGSPIGFVGAGLLVGVPVFDAALAVGRRVASGRSPLHGDRRHFYDELLRLGLAPRQTLAVGCAIQLACVGGGIWLLSSR
jgi:UDP-GlcNAc:undecaprenyl-phosphate GlcNAc-1-phosphate transferase